MLRFRKMLLAVVLACLGFAKASAVPTFTQEFDLLFSSAAPQQILPIDSGWRMYFIRDDFRVHSATSSDRMNWVEEPGVRLSTATAPAIDSSSITHCHILNMPTTGYRMLYSAVSSSGVYSILSATSTDGLTWTKEPGMRLTADSETDLIRSPRILQPSSALHRMYFVQKTSASEFSIRSATSTSSGTAWAIEAGTRVVGAFSTVSVSTLSDGRVRLFYSELESGATVARTIAASVNLSTDSETFASEGTIFSTAATSGEIDFPLIDRATDTFRFRLYFGFKGAASSATLVHSLLTAAPAIDSASPSRASTTDSSLSVSITGEIFGSTPTVTYTRGQNTITATSVTRGDDQTLTVALSPFNAAEGSYTLTVTNPDGVSTSLTGALTITVPGGTLTLTDNLMRPRQGDAVAITVQTFQAGEVTIRVYDFAGRLVRTLVQQQQAAGTLTTQWDGKTDSGREAVSGVYLIHAQGPNLSQIKKAVLLR